MNTNLVGRRISQAKPDIALLVDSYTPLASPPGDTWYSISGSRYSNPWAQTYGVHNDGQNVAFLDAHVRPVTVEPHPPAPMAVGSDCVDMAAAWFWPLQ